MSLRDKLLHRRSHHTAPNPLAAASSGTGTAQVVPTPAPAPAPAAHAMPPGVALRPEYQRIKMNVHQAVIDRVELEKLHRLSHENIRRELARVIEEIIGEEKLLMNDAERRRLVYDVYNEMFGFGPLEPLLQDPAISDILVNAANRIYVERGGRLEMSDVTFYDDAHLLKVIERIVSRVGRRIDESSPMVDARLPDGSRVNAIIAPCAIDGPSLSIRRFPDTALAVSDLVAYKSIAPIMATVLEAFIKAKLNVVISGGTGSGKTTLLNLLSSFIPDNERIITIEDAAELRLQQEHVLRLETRPPNVEGKGEVTQRALVRNALRMRPDRIVLGEVRGAEAVDMLAAMNTGHEGSLATLHANNPRNALARLENMVMAAGMNMPAKAIRSQIASAVNIVVQVSRLSDGQRKIMSIQEVTGMEGDVVTMQELFRFYRTGVESNGKVAGYFESTSVRPFFFDRLAAYGQTLPDDAFNGSWRFEG